MSAGPVAASEALHRRVRAFARGEPGEDFDAPACDIARFQAAHQPRLGRLYRRAGVEPAGLGRAADVPAVPAEAFKPARIACHPPELDAVVFRTSGTTSGARGEHPLRTTATYDELALAVGRRTLAPHGGPLRVVARLRPGGRRAAGGRGALRPAGAPAGGGAGEGAAPARAAGGRGDGRARGGRR